MEDVFPNVWNQSSLLQLLFDLLVDLIINIVELAAERVQIFVRDQLFRARPIV
jgi:hypothetical protein